MAPPPTSAYVDLAADERGHCSWFLARTNKEHQATMDHPFMKSIYAKTFDSGAYVAHLCGQYRLFTELESLCALHRDSRPLSAVYDEVLHRGASLASDLRFWAGDAWQSSVAAAPSRATAKYMERLQADSSDPWLLLCHHFLNYNAVLSGGQFLGKMVSERAGTEQACKFYTFPAECQPVHDRVQLYIDQMDKLPISEEVRGRMLECMQAVYRALLEMFDEVYAMAPVQGIAYGQGRSSATAPPGPGSKIPPPLNAADKKIPFSDLKKHNAMDAVERGVPMLTSLLGRVYDVSAAKDLFGAGAPYEMFTGHDGTYNLAVMSLKKKTLNKFDYVLDAEEKECLSDWIAYFDNRHGRPVGLLSGRTHSITLSDLPPATKIPFSEDLDDESGPVSKL